MTLLTGTGLRRARAPRAALALTHRGSPERQPKERKKQAQVGNGAGHNEEGGKGPGGRAMSEARLNENKRERQRNAPAPHAPRDPQGRRGERHRPPVRTASRHHFSDRSRALEEEVRTLVKTVNRSFRTLSFSAGLHASSNA